MSGIPTGQWEKMVWMAAQLPPEVLINFKPHQARASPRGDERTHTTCGDGLTIRPFKRSGFSLL